MTLREQLTVLLDDQVDPLVKLVDVPPEYKEAIHHVMSARAARLSVFLWNNAAAIRDALP